MRILLLSQFFWPEERTAPTNLAAMAADLHQKGHDLLIITGFPNHPFGKVYEGYRQRLWQWDSYQGVPILRLPLYPNHSTSLKKRLLNYFSFMLSAIVLGTFTTIRFRPEILFVYYAPLTMGWPATWLKLISGAKLVYWVTDLWPENLRATGARISDRLYKLLRRIEDWGYRQADQIFVDSPGYRTNLIEKGVTNDKIQVIVEWADENLFFPVQREKTLAEQFGLANKFNIIYGGNLGTVQGLTTVVDAAALVQHLPDVQFVFIGDGNEVDALQLQTKQKQLTNVTFIARQPMQEIHRFFAWADVLLVHLKAKPIFQLQLPSKIIAYLACGRPILCAVPGSSAKVVTDANAGLCCPSENPEALAEAIITIRQMSAQGRETLGRNGYQTYLRNYTREVQVNRIDALFQQLCQSATYVQKGHYGR